MSSKHGWIWGCLIVLGPAVVGGCSGDVAMPSIEHSKKVSGPRQLDDHGTPLPFRTSKVNRWNSANNGTSYEPCTALTQFELTRLGIDVSSVRDAAGTDGQTLRGCAWKAFRVDGAVPWSISQFVGNSQSLADDKNLHSTADDVWLPDISIDARRVGVHRWLGDSSCDTYVQSGAAAVNTMVVYHGDSPPPSEICDRALAFTRATISKMPL